MNAAELKIADPKRFDKRYYKWAEHALDYDWWDYTKDRFKEDCEAKGIWVKDIHFSLPGSAAFEGRMNSVMFMERSGLAEQYPALYLAIADYGPIAYVTCTRNNNPSVSFDSYAIQTGPSGMFAGLDQQAWEELIESQEAEANLEAAMQEEAVDLSNELYTMLSEESEYLTSEAAYIEYCDANDITFETEEDRETDR